MEFVNINEMLTKNLKELSGNVENTEKYSTTLDMNTGKIMFFRQLESFIKFSVKIIAIDTERMEVLEKKLQSQREALKTIKNDYKIVNLKKESENYGKLEKL